MPKSIFISWRWMKPGFLSILLNLNSSFWNLAIYLARGVLAHGLGTRQLTAAVARCRTSHHRLHESEFFPRINRFMAKILRNEIRNGKLVGIWSNSFVTSELLVTDGLETVIFVLNSQWNILMHALPSFTGTHALLMIQALCLIVWFPCHVYV